MRCRTSPSPVPSAPSLSGPSCNSGEFCNYPVTELCGAADGSGVCTVPPTGCDTSVAPVCGCDGHQYTNAVLYCLISGVPLHLFREHFTTPGSVRRATIPGRK